MQIASVNRINEDLQRAEGRGGTFSLHYEQTPSDFQKASLRDTGILHVLSFFGRIPGWLITATKV